MVLSPQLAAAQEAAAKANESGVDSDAEAPDADAPRGLSRDVVAALTGVQEDMEEEGAEQGGAAAAQGQGRGRRSVHPAEAEGKLGGAQDGTLGVAEEQGVGAVSFTTAAWYLSKMGGLYWVTVQLVLLTCERLTYLSTDYFLTTWARPALLPSRPPPPFFPDDDPKALSSPPITDTVSLVAFSTQTAAQYGPPNTVFGHMVGMPKSSGPGLFYGVQHATFYGVGYVVCSCANMVFAIGRTARTQRIRAQPVCSVVTDVRCPCKR